MDTLNGKLTISRHTSNKEADYISIEVTDESSGITFIAVKCSVEALGFALTGLGYMGCEFELFGIQNVGAQREMKTETVLVNVRNPKYEDVIEAAKSHETDGWRHFMSSMSRIHGSNWDGSTCSVEVTFTRFVRE